MSSESVRRERERLVAEYARREREVDGDRYAAWQPAEILMRDGRRRTAARLLHRCGLFPGPGDRCLEVGYGRGGWLPDLLGWGVPVPELHGIELDAGRAEVARRLLPAADLRVGDASELPWPDGSFRMVVASTVFTSILDPAVRQAVAGEIRRVLEPGGALLWYDFARNNPRNPNVRRVGRAELRALFPGLTGPVRRVTLAPPLARAVAPRWYLLAQTLETLRWLRTHLLAVLVKGAP